MPILIKGSGGAQKAPTISVSGSGLITATAGKKSVTHQLSSSDDADFVESNIANDVEIFGKTGTYGRRVSATIAVDADAGRITLTLSEAIKGVRGGGLYSSLKRSESASHYPGYADFFCLIFTNSTRAYIRNFDYNWENQDECIDTRDTVTFELSSDGTKLVSTSTLVEDLLGELDWAFNEAGLDTGLDGRLIVY